MYTPKEDIYSALSTLGATVVQGSQNIFTETPAITFTISDNAIELDLDNEINSQSIIATIDIWSETSSAATDLLKSVEETMRDIGYKMTYSADIPRPDGALYHINCRFETVR